MDREEHLRCKRAILNCQRNRNTRTEGRKAKKELQIHEASKGCNDTIETE